jgi:hypothetical protein
MLWLYLILKDQSSTLSLRSGASALKYILEEVTSATEQVASSAGTNDYFLGLLRTHVYYSEVQTCPKSPLLVIRHPMRSGMGLN